MAEYYVNPNVSHVSPSSVSPASNLSPFSNVSPVANVAPAMHAPTMYAPAQVKGAPYPVAPAYGRTPSADAILVLFILLVIISRVCY